MTRLRGVEPAQIIKRFKAFWYGETGTHKTKVSIQFPRPYMIDTEQGATNDQYAQAIRTSEGHHWFTTDLDEIIEEVVALMTERHSFKTLIIDPITVPYNEAVDKAAREIAARAKDPRIDGTEYGRHRAVADRKMKRLFNLLTNLDMNVILTSHAKTKWLRQGDQITEAGTTFDAYSKLEYLFDLVLETQKRGQERWARVMKSRIEAFPEGDTFQFSYPEIARRYGLQVMEKPSEPVVPANDAQIFRLQHLTEVLKIDEGQIARWLTKAGAEEYEDLSTAQAAQLIAWLEAKVTTPEAPVALPAK